jgi:hypothetical protein
MTQQDALVAIAGLLEEVLVAEVQAEVFRLSHDPRLAAAVEVVPATAEEVAASPAKATAAAEASASASAAAPTAGASTPPAQPTPQTTPSQKRRRYSLLSCAVWCRVCGDAPCGVRVGNVLMRD